MKKQFTHLTPKLQSLSFKRIIPAFTALLKAAGLPKALPILFCFLLLGSYAKAQVLADGNGAAAALASSTAVNSSISLPNFTVAAGTDKLLVVTVRGSNNQTISTLTYNSQNLVRLGSPVANGGGRMEIWYLVMGNVGTAVTSDIVATSSGGQLYLAIAAASYQHVDQATPLENLVSDITNTASATSLPISITGNIVDLAVDGISSLGIDSTPASFTVATGQTEEATGSNFQPNGAIRLSTSSKGYAASGPETMDWSISGMGGTVACIHIGAVIRGIATYEMVVTTTNGCSEDGSYGYTALENGKPKYVHTTESNYSIFWDGSKWVLDDSGFTVYENTADTPLPPCGVWDDQYCTFGLVSGCTTPDCPPSVSIAADPGSSITTGTSVTFTATPTNGGSTPSYQWKVNGGNVGMNQATFTSTTLEDGDVVTCEMTSSEPCADPTMATSNAVTMEVLCPTTTYEVTVTVNTSGNSAIAPVFNPGGGELDGKPFWTGTAGEAQNLRWSAANSRWEIVNAGGTVRMFNTNVSDLNMPCTGWQSNAYGPAVTLSSNGMACGNIIPVPPPASVSIAADPGSSIATGTSVTFTATPTNGGTMPSYQWKVNGGNVGTDQDTYTSTTLANGDEITCEMTSNDPCADPMMATSNAIVMSVTTPVNGSLILLATSSTSSGSSQGNGAAMDASGNTYLTGRFTGSITFGSSTLQSAGGQDVFVVKYNTEGNVVWARRAGGTANDTGAGISVSGNGVYVAGSIGDIANFNTPSLGGSNELTAWGATDGFLAKYDTDGNVLWIRRMGGAIEDVANCVSAVGSAIYVGGSFKETANFNTPSDGSTNTLTAAHVTTYSDGFVAKFDDAGTFLWAKRMGGILFNSTNVYGIAADANGVYATGDYSSTINFNTPHDPSSNTITSSGNNDLFIAGWDASGSFQWARSAGGASDNDKGNAVAVSSSGVYVTGSFRGTTATFSGTTINSAQSTSGNEAFLAKYDASGTLQWVRRAGSVNGDNGFGIAANTDNVYIVGNFNGGGTVPGCCQATFNTPHAYGSNDLFPNSASDIYIAEFDADGTFNWAKRGGGTGVDFGYGVAISGSKASITGYYSMGTADFNTPSASGSNEISTTASTESFFAQYSITAPCSLIPSVSIAADPGNSITPGTSVTFTATPTNGGSTPSYQWKVNGGNVGTGQDTYTSTTLADGDEVNCEMTSSDPCADPMMATSNAITMEVATICTRTYVTTGGTGSGTSWADATSDLAAAISNSCEVWVAEGTYYASSTGNRDASFLPGSGVQVYGGFDGTEMSLSERDVTGNPTILSGDINTPNVHSDNTRTLIRIENLAESVRLDGFYIQNATNEAGDGGVWVTNSAADFANCFFSNHSAYNISALRAENANTNFENCEFNNCGGQRTIINFGIGTMNMVNCSIHDNAGGGGIGNGGGCTLDLVNCLVANNTGPNLNGVAFSNGGTLSLTNCTVVGNTGYDNAGINSSTSATVRNCIFWHNNGGSGISGTHDITYSNIQCGYAGTGNIAENPRFVSSTDFRLGACSSSINAGDNSAVPTGVTTDLGGNARIFNTTVDMGAYENNDGPVTPGRMYVTPTGTGDGSSWANATGDLQAAIDNCAIEEVWVAEGTYKPTAYPYGCVGCNNVRDYAFVLKNGIKVYGGFVGTEAALADRVPGHETILSGDVDNNDIWDDGNAYHVVMAFKSEDILLDGLTIKHGYGLAGGGSPCIEGEGVDRNDGALILSNVTTATLNNVVFMENSGRRTIFNKGSSVTNTLNATNCLVLNNTGGVALSNSQGTMNIINCTVVGNTGFSNPALESSPPATVTNCIFWNNNNKGGIPFGNNVTYSDIQCGYEGTGNIALYPKFLSSTDFRLGDCSPAINAGDNAAVPAGITTDLDGAVRIFDTTVDMGAYENPDGYVPVVPVRMYVTPTGTGDGSSWANATGDLQAALDNCATNEVWVAAGTYKPTAYPLGCTSCSSPRNYAFFIKDGMKVYGGFAGGEAALTDRVPGNETILSGDVDNNNIWDSGNAYHIVVSSNANDIVLDGLTIKNGYADGSGFDCVEGADIYRNSAAVVLSNNMTATINNVKFLENYADSYGAAVYTEYSGGHTAFINCEFSDNYSDYYGGAIYTYESGYNGGHTKVENCQFTGNYADYYGGAIYSEDSYGNDTISNCQFTGNESDYYAGAIYLDGSGYNEDNFTAILGCTFEDNYASYYGGAIYSDASYGNDVIADCQFTGNGTDDYAGAIYLYYSGYNESNFTTITGCGFTENYSYYGGAIYSEYSYGNDVIADCQFTGNSTGDYGGAIYLYESGYNEINYTTIEGCEFTENNSSNGGAIYSEYSYGNDTIRNCQFIDNTSSEDGGGIYLYYSSYNDDNYTTIMDCQFTGNTSGEDGGAIMSEDGDGNQIIRCTFLENEAVYGGAVEMYDYSSLITDCLFAKNTATNDGTGYGAGGALYATSGDLQVVNCTFADNIATNQPGGAIANDDELTLTNCIFWGNVQQGAGTIAQQQVYNDGGTVEISYTLLQDTFPADATDNGNNIYCDPLFTDAANDDYTLQSCSPAINAGDNAGVAATDLPGAARIQDGTVDMGAYENTPSPYRITAITVGNISAADCNNTLCTSDDTYTADVTVTYSGKPASGTLALSGTDINGMAPSVDVSSAGANSHTFTGVTFNADGEMIGLTATFSEGCSITCNVGTAPAPCSGGTPYTPSNITVSGFGCFGPEGTYSPNGTVNGAPAWLSGFGFTIEWSGSQWEIEGMSFVWSANSTGSITNLPCSGGWTDPTLCALGPGTIALSGGCGNLTGSGPSCSVSDITLDNTSACNGNGTTTETDDYFTADVTVTFAYAPAGGTLTLKRGTTVLATTTDDLTCTTTHTFTGVQMAADGSSIVLTAEFTSGCTYTSGTLMTAPDPCSCQPTTAFTACPNNLPVNVDPASCTAAVSYTATANGDPAPSYTYSFSGATTDSGSGTGSGSTFNLGMTNVTVTAINDCGMQTCQFSITVSDNIMPSVTCKNANIVLNASGAGSITTADVFQSGSDNCGTVNQVGVSPNNFSCSNLGPNQVTLTVNDGNGNTNTCTATVTVTDNTQPTALCKNITVNPNASGTVSITPTQVNNGSTDNCGTVNLVSVSPNSFTCSNLGPNQVTLTVNDGNGNTNTCTATVTVQDNTPPTALCQNATLNIDANGMAGLLATQVNNGSTDNCGTVNLQSVSPNSFTCGNLGPNQVALTVNDGNGNTNTCNATVTVQDITQPNVVCKNHTAALNANGSATITTADAFDNGSDNCGTVNQVSVLPNSFTCSNLGANQVALTVNDGNGNTNTCNATVTVQDNTPPTAICQNSPGSSTTAAGPVPPKHRSTTAPSTTAAPSTWSVPRPPPLTATTLAPTPSP
ncbi:MAG: right-handed parallel beta-helix repeat-containing protein [Nitrospira sp.]|nr:right-handed parallel beta-helix repeat-containing protein [Nitrospira sp.]